MLLIKKYYLVAVLLMLGQIVGGVVADISVIMSFSWSLLYFSFTKEVDLVLIVLLLVPSIVFRNIHLENG